MESLESAQLRGANIIAEIQGFGQTSDGHDMVQPSGEGAVRVCKWPLKVVQLTI